MLVTQGARATVAAIVCGCVFVVSAPRPAQAVVWYVASGGAGDQSGTSATNALASIQDAVDLAWPGDTVRIQPGEYWEDLDSKRPGLPDAPILLLGAEGVVVRGVRDGRPVVRIGHSYVELRDFEINGDPGVRAATDRRSGSRRFREKLVYVKGAVEPKGITGVRLLSMRLRNAATECVRFKYFAHNNEVARSTIENCGLLDFPRASDPWQARGQKNGEGIYIGTALNQRDRNPTTELDASNGNLIHHNEIRSGGECVDIKEGSRDNRIVYNRCSDQRDVKSGGISVRGDANVVHGNTIRRNLGAGVRIGGGAGNGLRNRVTENLLIGNREGALKIMVEPQGQLCGNRIGKNGAKAVRGPGAANLDAGAACELAGDSNDEHAAGLAP